MRYFLVLIVAAVGVFAQTPAAFEAASIRKSPPLAPRGSFRVQPETLQVENLSLWELTAKAFGLFDYQFAAPDSMKDIRFVITARSAMPVSRQQMMTMLQKLLEDRFHLTYHWADKTIPAYVLGPDGDHHGLRASILAEDDPGVGYSFPRTQDPLKRVIAYKRVTMRFLADSLTGGPVTADLPVLDRTGLTGFYDFTLTFNLTGPSPSKVEDGDVPVSVSSQLGISVKQMKTPVRVLFVDHADAEPTEN